MTRQIKNNPQSKLGLFTECERLTKTKLSGLQLNDAKTDILALKSIIVARGIAPIRCSNNLMDAAKLWQL